MHIVDHLSLPDGYSARPYRGVDDHQAMVVILNAYRVSNGEYQQVTLDQMNSSYANLVNCDPDRDLAIIEHHGEMVGYVRNYFDDLESGIRQCEIFAPTTPGHVEEALFTALVAGQERHMTPWGAGAANARFAFEAAHPGPGLAPTGEAAWLESFGYTATHWGAKLVRPDLGEIPDLPLPEGVEIRPVLPEQIKHILKVHWEAFRGEWDFREATPEDLRQSLDDPLLDETLWQVAWVGDTVVGQVKPFINDEENEACGYLRGYTEYISTHSDWRNQGIAGALLARSLIELKRRGMTSAALGVDTNNPGGAFHLYTKLGFQLSQYGAVYTKPVPAQAE